MSKWQKTSFLWVLPLLDVRHHCIGKYHCMHFQGEHMIQTQWWKILFWANFRPVGPKFGPPFFLSKIWLHQSLDIMVSYHHVQYQKKQMIQSWEHLVSDRQTDRQREESDFIGNCLTNIEHLTIFKIHGKSFSRLSVVLLSTKLQILHSK